MDASQILADLLAEQKQVSKEQAARTVALVCAVQLARGREEAALGIAESFLEFLLPPPVPTVDF